MRDLVKVAGPRATLALVVAAASGILLSAADLALPPVLLRFIAALKPSVATPNPQRLPSGALALMAILVGLALLRAAGRLLARLSGAAAHEAIAARLRRHAVDTALGEGGLPALSAADLHHLLNEIVPKAARYCRNGVELLASGLHALALVAGLVALEPRLGSLGVLLLSCIGLLLFPVHRRTARAARGVPLAHRAISRRVEQVARNWLLLRVLGTVPRERRALHRAIEAYRRHALWSSGWAYAGTALPAALGVIALVALLGASAGLAPVDPARLVPLAYLFLRLVQVSGALGGGVGSLVALGPQFRTAVTALGAARRAGLAAPSPSEPPGELPPSLAIRGCTFAYPGARAPLWSGLSLSLEGGGRLAVAGCSGAGKSTLLGLVAGVGPPSSGQVLLGGVPAEAVHAAGRLRMGYVGPEPYLIAGSVRENLLYGSPGGPPPDEDLWRALECAALAPRIRTMPDGLEQRLGPGALLLSTGEQQRLCLARALLMRPHLLLLDEATASLDARTEGSVLRALSLLRGRCTVVIASHRPRVLAWADQVVHLPGSLPRAATVPDEKLERF